ncbi:uncharacterized protein LOC107221819 [Neodiprion lecontei]|uniref:Uncharacterized protein LOC107221819 n=1 Tax=Neodiprion lecontei TaxID=441921 RepID=A0ABM3GBP0_NEOLC|nr:uncharacterized protein LOC107221819 [Neodiprion lecontei]
MSDKNSDEKKRKQIEDDTTKSLNGTVSGYFSSISVSTAPEAPQVADAGIRDVENSAALFPHVQPKSGSVEERNDGDNDEHHDFESLEYEEDVYYNRDIAANTPSFDDIDELSDSDEIVVHCWRGSSGDIEEIVVDDSMYCISVETDFNNPMQQRDIPQTNADAESDPLNKNEKKFMNLNKNNNKSNFNSVGIGKKKRSVRVIFQDLSKPYLAKISSSQNYKKFLEIVKGEEASPHPVDPLSTPTDDFVARGILEEREQRRDEWTAELAKVEEEIQTLRHVLASKVKVSQELKRKLGIGAWKELTDDVNQGLRNVKESQVFQKTESVIKTTAEKTSSILGGFGSGISMKLGQMRNSESFRSLEERVGSAYENVKTKVVPSRSNSTQSFDEALREAEATRRASAIPIATSPTIPEDKPLS